MNLSKRLDAIAGYIPQGSTVADIGTDHLQLPVYLVNSGRCRSVIASELNQLPYRQAENLAVFHRLTEKIQVRLGDGLKVLSPGEAEIVVIAGIGGDAILKMLSDSPETLKTIKRLILQPMTGAGRLRLWLVQNGWRIGDETLVEEKGRLYCVIMAEPGRERALDKFIIEIGPRLAEKNNLLVNRYLRKLYTGYQKLADKLSGAASPAAKEKALEIKEKLTRIKEVLAKNERKLC
ncbi:MAG: hypothetical protein XD78_1713 [Desulfotomaculum sp. 46_296]|nr:MAG: hypothetical protein XD78_1713 [Desulfotomaculum sp. 46_296]